MKTFNFEFTKEELSVLRHLLKAHISDVQMDIILNSRVGLPIKSSRKELLFTDSILSKLS